MDWMLQVLGGHLSLTCNTKTDKMLTIDDISFLNIFNLEEYKSITTFHFSQIVKPGEIILLYIFNVTSHLFLTLSF